MNFRWNMTEEDFKRMRSNVANNKYDSNNCYGNLYVGRMCIDFMTEDFGEDELDVLPMYNVYVAGNVVQDGDCDGTYGELNDGTPYDLIPGSLSFGESMDKTKMFVGKKRKPAFACEMLNNEFEEFKRQFEKMFEDYTNSEEDKYNKYLDRWKDWAEDETEKIEWIN